MGIEGTSLPRDKATEYDMAGVCGNTHLSDSD